MLSISARYGAVERLAQDVGAARVTVRLGEHLHERAVQGDPVTVVGPVRHLADDVLRALVAAHPRSACGSSSRSSLGNGSAEGRPKTSPR